jgi:molybdopterin-dependent oxidoreductase alpha subunit
MGINEKPSEAFLNNLEQTFSFKAPRNHGFDTVESIHAMHERKAKIFFAMGGNFLSATPDTVYTAEALSKCDLTVHVSTKLNRSHLIHGQEAIILPCLARSDKDLIHGSPQFITTENSMGVIQMSKGNLNPVSDELLSEVAIICRLAKETLGTKSRTNWSLYNNNYDEIRTSIEKTIPGFNDYNKRVRIPGGFYLPNSAREGSFNTLNKKANFNIAAFEKTSLANDELMMMTIRSHDQFNTTIYGLNDRYRGISNERRVVFMNESDIRKFNLKKGDVIDLINHHGGKLRVAHKFIVIPFSIPEGCTATYFPETNVLVPIDSTAEKSNTPTSKLVVIKVKLSE